MQAITWEEMLKISNFSHLMVDITLGEALKFFNVQATCNSLEVIR